MIRDLIKSITKQEWYFLVAITLFVIIITTAPYIYGWLQTPAGYIYTGLHSLTPGDIHVYYSYIEQARNGHFFFTDLYTTETQARIILNSFWAVEGYLANIFNLSNILIFQITRILLIPFLLFTIYLLASYFFRDKHWRQIAFIFLIFASGWGLLFSFFKTQSIYSLHWYNWPLDLWAAESNIFLTTLQSPHLIASTILLLLILWLGWLSFDNNQLKYSLVAGLLAFLLFSFHPFHIPTVLGVLGAYIFIQALKNIPNLKTKETQNTLFNYLKHFLIILGLSFPIILYYLLTIQYDFITQMRSWQNVCLTPSLAVTIVSYGLILILSIFAIYKIIKSKNFNNQNIFLITWLTVQFILIYSPFDFQRRLVQGLQIPMNILAVTGLYYIYEFLKKKMSPQKFDFFIQNKYFLTFLFILIFSSSNLHNLVREFAVFNEYHVELYLSQSQKEAYDWLKNNTDKDDVIMSDYINSNFIPGQSVRFVYAGHAVETLFYNSKYKNIIWFFVNNEPDDKKQNFLKTQNIDYIFYTSELEKLGNFNPAAKDYLDLVFSQGDVKIYEVMD